MSELYPNLPGYKTILTDGNLRFTPNIANTDSVLLIGIAEKGGINPKRITSLSAAEAEFGQASVASNLVLAFQEALDAGCQDIRMLALPIGTTASIPLQATGSTPGLVIKGAGRGPNYNGIQVTVSSAPHQVVVSGGPISGTFTFSSTSPTTLTQLVANINASLANEFIVAELAVGATGTALATTLMPGVFNTIGGNFTHTQVQLKDALAQAYALVEDYDADIVVPLGAHADNTVQAFAQQLADFCGRVAEKNKIVHGVIATAPLVDYNLNTIASAVTTLGALPNTYFFNTGEEIIDAGKYINVVVGEAVFANGRIGIYNNTMAAAYAGLIAALSSQSATTNKSVPNARSLAYTFSSGQLNTLTGARLVTFRNRPGRGIVVTDGVTSAAAGSDYTRLTTVRTVATVVSVIREAADPFIGESSGIVQRNALNTAIKSALNKLQDTGVIQQFAFVINATTQEMVQGVFNITVELVPVFELRKIRTTITLRPEL